MKKILKLGVALLIVAMMFGVMGCFEPEEDDTDTGGLDFTNYTTTGDVAIAFRNNSGKELVVFKGLPKPENLLGGISLSQNHGISKSKNLKHFQGNEAFPAFIITKEQYEKNITNLIKLEYEPFTRLYVFYNAEGTNDTQYEISSLLGGNERYLSIVVPTNAGFNVELREKGTTGPTLGFAQSGILETKLFIQPDTDTSIFPVFLRYNKLKNILQTNYPTFTDRNGRISSYYFFVALTQEDPQFYIDLSDIVNNQEFTLDMGMAYVTITNDCSGGMLSLFGGNDQPIKNSLGVSSFGSGQKTFDVKMANVQGSDSFASYRTWSGQVGMIGRRTPIVDKNDATKSQWDLENGKLYQVYANGNISLDQHKATLDFATPETVTYTDGETPQ